MSFDVKLALFWLGVYIVMCLLRAGPASAVARVALAWIGPVPREGELRSHYLHRQALFALGWLAQLLVIAALLTLLCQAIPALANSQAFIVVAGFALVIGLGMAVLGALLAWLGSMKARLLGPNDAWRAPAATPLEDDDEFRTSRLD